MTYHIDQLGRVVQEVPETRACEGCIYHGKDSGYICRNNETPIERACSMNNTIYKLVVPDTTT